MDKKEQDLQAKNSGLDTPNSSWIIMLLTGIFYDKSAPKSRTLGVMNILSIVLFFGFLFFLFKMASNA